MESHPVDAFYQWLIPHLGEVFEDSAVQTELSIRLEAIYPDIRWEVGPFDDERSFFAFSPDNRVKALSLTTELAERAPSVAGWVFLSARPRKRWQSRCITFKESDGTQQRFEMDDWLYSLTSFNDGEFFDVNLVPLGTTANGDELERAAHMLVEFELGERLFLEFVDRVNIITRGELTHAGDQISNLHDHLLQLLAKHQRH